MLGWFRSTLETIHCVGDHKAEGPVSCSALNKKVSRRYPPSQSVSLNVAVGPVELAKIDPSIERWGFLQYHDTAHGMLFSVELPCDVEDEEVLTVC